MARGSQIIQLLVSLSVFGLLWLTYPGVMVLIASAAGLVYVAASIGALRGGKLAGGIAFTFSLVTVVLTTLAVLRFARGGFSYVSGNFEWHEGIYWTPYAFLAIAFGAALAVVMRLVSWRQESGRPQS